MYPRRATSDTKKQRLEDFLNAFVEVLVRNAYKEKHRRTERSVRTASVGVRPQRPVNHRIQPSVSQQRRDKEWDTSTGVDSKRIEVPKGSRTESRHPC